MARGPKLTRKKSTKSRRVRSLKRTRNPVLSARAKAYVKPAPATSKGKRKRVSQVSLAKRAKPGTAALKAAVVKNAKAIRSIRTSAWGKYQTANSHLIAPPGSDTPEGGQPFSVSRDLPVILHLNNLHSEPLKGSPHFYKRRDKTAAGADIEMDETGIVDEFTSLGRFSSTGVLQKSIYDRSTGTNMVPKKTPYPNGEKIKWHGTDLTFEISGYLRNTTFDFWIVQEKPRAKPYDPWNTKTDSLLTKARHLPYTLQEFARVSDRMAFEKIDTKKYKILGHKRAFVNNMQDSAEDSLINKTIENVTGQRHLGPNTGGTVVNGVPFGATTKPRQYVHIKFCPHEGVYPLKKSIGEAVDAREKHEGFRPNPYEVRSLGTMAWDNFDPKVLTLTLTLTGRRP